jgi:AraC-like DNA-binding protein
MQSPLRRITSFPLHPALQGLIQHIVIIEVDYGQHPYPISGHFMPSTEHALFINLFTRFTSQKAGENRSQAVTASTLLGAQVTPFKLQVSESHTAISILFQPGSLYRFLHIPLYELFDQGFPAAEVMGREIEALVERMHEEPTPAALNLVIQRFFLSKISKTKEYLPLDHALRYLQNHYLTDMDTAARMACMSVRTFERKCRERLGMSPKLFARIARFHRAYKYLEAGKYVSMADLTYTLGYYDQTHFIKDFKQFAHLTPTVLHRELEQEHMQFQLDWGAL